MEKMRKIELLAPAGSEETLRAAVQAGADAVYLAGQQFGARQYAGNFGPEELKAAVEYCHLRDVKVYGALNTLIKEEEMTDALRAAGVMYEAGVDALIVQDWGLVANLRETLPDLELHGSTQMSIYDESGAVQAARMGLKRIVIARETPIETIATIVENVPIEIEAFVHGALCYSYSGQCLLSSQIGGRSGNRGRCAQPCRKSYQLKSAETGSLIKEGYVISTKDLDTREDIEKILNSGVVSLKIEGRMRKPDYVASVTAAYRQLIDSHLGVLENETESPLDLSRVFNRATTAGRILGASGPEMINTEAPGNMGVIVGKTGEFQPKHKRLLVTLTAPIHVGDGLKIMLGDGDTGVQITSIFHDGVQVTDGFPGQTVAVPLLRPVPTGMVVRKTFDALAIEEAEKLGRSERRTIPYEASIRVIVGEPIQLVLTDDRGNRVAVESETPVEPAKTAGITEERIAEQLKKSGDALFHFAGVTATLDGNGFVPVSVLNQLRRDGLDQLKAIRAVWYPQRKALKAIGFPGAYEPRKEPRLWSVMVTTVDQLRALKGATIDRIDISSLALLPEAMEITVAEGKRLRFVIPAVTGKPLSYWVETLSPYKETLEVLAGNLGQLELAQSGFKVYGDYTLNVFNSASARTLNEMGCMGVTLSVELNRQETRDIRREMPDMPLELIVYGRLPVMTSPICPVGCEKPCTGTKLRAFTLEDDRGYRFPAHCREGIFEVWNSRILNLVERIEPMKLDGLGSLQLRFTEETPQGVRAILESFLAAVQGAEAQGIATFDKEKHTTGSYKRGVE